MTEDSDSAWGNDHQRRRGRQGPTTTVPRWTSAGPLDALDDSLLLLLS